MRAYPSIPDVIGAGVDGLADVPLSDSGLLGERLAEAIMRVLC